MEHTLRRQRGIGLMAFLFFLALIIFFVTVALKLGPYYMEYLTVRSVMNELREDPSVAEGGTRNVLSTIDKRLYINAVDGVDMKAFKYKKTESGYSVSVKYQKQEHLFGNLDVLMSFSHQVQVDKR